MKPLYYLLFFFIFVLFSSCTSQKNIHNYYLPEISKIDEEKEIFLQKKILINEMILASRLLHKISWPILKKNIDICNSEGPYSFGIIYAAQEDLPENERKNFKNILNKNVQPTYFKENMVESFPLIISVAKDSPGFYSNVQAGDIVLRINDLNVTNFRKKLRSSISISSKLELIILRDNKVFRKKIDGINICNYNIQAIPAAAPNAYADGEKVFITLAAIKLAQTEDELAFLIGHELAHNIYHYKSTGGSEADSLTISYRDGPKIKSFSSFFLMSSKKKETEADLRGVEIAFKAGYKLKNVNDYWRRLSVFNPSLITNSSAIYKSNATRAIMISRTLERLRKLDEKK